MGAFSQPASGNLTKPFRTMLESKPKQLSRTIQAGFRISVLALATNALLAIIKIIIGINPYDSNPPITTAGDLTDRSSYQLYYLASATDPVQTTLQLPTLFLLSQNAIP